MKSLSVESASRAELIDITGKVEKAAVDSGIKDGIIFIYVPHTTAGLTVNENADPSVRKDIATILNRLIPVDSAYEHAEGNSDAHVKQSMFGNELYVFIENGRLALGTWQGIYFCEFDGPRKRQVYLKAVKT